MERSAPLISSSPAAVSAKVIAYTAELCASSVERRDGGASASPATADAGKRQMCRRPSAVPHTRYEPHGEKVVALIDSVAERVI